MDKLVVFDLDFTLWDAGGTWCDCTNPPYKRVNNHVVDTYGAKIVLYPDVKGILEDLKSKNITMALASRTSAPSWARQLLKLFDIEDYFTYQEIYPSSKIAHFNQLQKDSGIPFEKMVFFDDEMRNIHDVGSMGVHAVFVDDGVNTLIVNDAIEEIS
nr:magnesium-dependent phosphatase-1 [uncultured Carboxylicivirga sp.]